MIVLLLLDLAPFTSTHQKCSQFLDSPFTVRHARKTKFSSQIHSNAGWVTDIQMVILRVKYPFKQPLLCYVLLLCRLMEGWRTEERNHLSLIKTIGGRGEPGHYWTQQPSFTISLTHTHTNTKTHTQWEISLGMSDQGWLPVCCVSFECTKTNKSFFLVCKLE